MDFRKLYWHTRKSHNVSCLATLRTNERTELTTLTFRGHVTSYRSRDHSIPHRPFPIASSINQGCNETFSFETETRLRPFETQTETFFKMSQTVQPVKLLASNCYKLCCVSFIYYAKHSSVSPTVLQKLSRHFPKDCQQFKRTPLLYNSCTMY